MPSAIDQIIAKSQTPQKTVMPLRGGNSAIDRLIAGAQSQPVQRSTIPTTSRFSLTDFPKSDQPLTSFQSPIAAPSASVAPNQMSKRMDEPKIFTTLEETIGPKSPFIGGAYRGATALRQSIEKKSLKPLVEHAKDTLKRANEQTLGTKEEQELAVSYLNKKKRGEQPTEQEVAANKIIQEKQFNFVASFIGGPEGTIEKQAGRALNAAKQKGITLSKEAVERVIEAGKKGLFQKTAQVVSKDLQPLAQAGVKIDKNGMATVYRGGNVSEAKLKDLRYNDYLSSVKEGNDITGNQGASSYGKTVIKMKIPAKDLKVENGEIKYIGKSSSLSSGSRYPQNFYKEYNDYHGSNLTAKEIDAQNDTWNTARALSGYDIAKAKNILGVPGNVEIKSQSQLTDFYNQATKGVNRTVPALEKEAGTIRKATPLQQISKLKPELQKPTSISTKGARSSILLRTPEPQLVQPRIKESSIKPLISDAKTLQTNVGVNVDNFNISKEGKDIINQTVEEVKPLIES